MCTCALSALACPTTRGVAICQLDDLCLASMEVPQDRLIRVGLDAKRRRWIFVHLLSGEQAALPAAGGRTWQVSVVEGCALLTCCQESVRADDLLKYKVVKSDSEELFLVGLDDEVISLHSYLQEHSRHDFSFGDTRLDRKFGFYLYAHSMCGASTWWSLKDIWGAMNLDTTMSEAQWRETWWPWWGKMLDSVGFPAVPHLRRAMPARACVAAKDLYMECIQTRHLDEASCSTVAMLAIMARSSVERGGTSNQAPKKKNIDEWVRLSEAFCGSFSCLSGRSEFTLYLDIDSLHCASLPPFGQDPVVLQLDDGFVNFGRLATAGHLGDKLFRLPGPNPSIAIPELLRRLVRAGKSVRCALAQFLAHFAKMLEAEVASTIATEGVPMDIDELQQDSLSALMGRCHSGQDVGHQCSAKVPGV